MCSHLALATSVRERRLVKGLTLKELASRSGLSVPFLSDIERGRRTPSSGELQQLRAALPDLGGSGGVRYPRGLQQLLLDPVLGPQITPTWVAALLRVEFRWRDLGGEQEWWQLYCALRDAVGPRERSLDHSGGP